jgi:predicted transcriptional regulator
MPGRKKKLTRYEFELMDVFWKLGPLSVREVVDTLPEDGRPAYTTVQTLIYRMEEKGAVRRVKKIGNAHVFEPAMSRSAAYGRVLDEMLELFGGSAQPLVACLVENGKLSLADIRAVEQQLRKEGRR